MYIFGSRDTTVCHSGLLFLLHHDHCIGTSPTTMHGQEMLHCLLLQNKKTSPRPSSSSIHLSHSLPVTAVDKHRHETCDVVLTMRWKFVVFYCLILFLLPVWMRERIDGKICFILVSSHILQGGYLARESDDLITELTYIHLMYIYISAAVVSFSIIHFT